MKRRGRYPIVRGRSLDHFALPVPNRAFVPYYETLPWRVLLKFRDAPNGLTANGVSLSGGNGRWLNIESSWSAIEQLLRARLVRATTRKRKEYFTVIEGAHRRLDRPIKLRVYEAVPRKLKRSLAGRRLRELGPLFGKIARTTSW